jgi:hypothetical protein
LIINVLFVSAVSFELQTSQLPNFLTYKLTNVLTC